VSNRRNLDEYLIAELCSGDESRIQAAIEVTYREFEGGVCGWLRGRFRSVPASEVAGAWVDALAVVLDKALKGTFRLEGSLFWYLCTIGARRCVDWLRDRRKEQVLPVPWDTVPGDRAAPHVVDGWWVDVLREVIRQGIDRLPPRPRLLWQVYADLGTEATLDELAQEASARAGEVVTDNAARRALQDGRVKLKAWVEEWLDGLDEWLRKQLEDWLNGGR
jgi:DNA-directed RNA polymerase specialized sigma24 family protein